MLKKIPTGFIDYKNLKEKNCYCVDKTLLIQEFLDKEGKVTLVTRPRRFGKTINMSMLAEFFDITKDSHQLFEGTKIMNTPYASEMNQYPTIFLTFADAKETKNKVVKYIKYQLKHEYERYQHIFQNIEEHDQEDYNDIMQGISDKRNGRLDDIDDAIVFLMTMLKKYYQKDVMLFIDEYDTPFIEAHVNGFYNEVKGDLSTLLRTSLKNSTCLNCAFLTGIQRVAKENTFSDLNSVDVYTVKDDEYASYFGFTTEETKELLEYYGLELNDDVKQMYDGYTIGHYDIYNPWSIMKYASRKKLYSYWVNTSAIVMIRNAFKEVLQKDNDFKREFEELILENKLETSVELETSFYEEASAATLWGYFINAGYLTIEKEMPRNKYVLRIPNNEVRGEITKLTDAYLSLPEGRMTKLMAALEDESQERFLDIYKTTIEDASYHDLTSENSYHMMLLGMCSELRPRYEIISNKEVGFGRCDLILKAKNTNQTSFVLEFKYLKEDVKNIQGKLEQLADRAVQQILDKQYDKELTGKVVYIGLAHHQKDVVMRWEERK